MRHIKLTLLTSLATVVAHAQTAATHFADPASASSSVSPVAGIAQSLFGLLLVLGVLFAGVWCLRRFKMVGQTGTANLSVIQGISLGAKERAVLIQVQGRRLLLGVAPGQVTLLAEVSRDDAATPVVDTAPKPVANNFKDILKRSLGLKTP